VPDDLVTQILKRLKGSPKDKADFINQLKNEQDLFNALKDAGFTPDVSDPQGRARSQPLDVLSSTHNIHIVDEVTLLKTLAELTLLKKVDEVTLMKVLEEITLIKTIRSAYIEGIGNIIRNSRFDDDTNYWTVSHAVRIAGGFYTDYALRLGNGADSAFAYQFLTPVLGLVLEGGLWYRSATVDAAEAVIYISYTDGANTSFTLNGTGSTWTFLNITGLSAAKKVKYILLQINAPYVMDITNVNIYPYFASEATLAALSAKITACNTGAVTVSSLPAITGTLTQSTKHDAKVYIYAFGDIAATGLLGLAKAANKVIKIHFYSLQSTVDGVTAYFYEETSTTQLSKKWVFNAREAQESPFVDAPANMPKCATQNKDMGINIAGGASPHIYWEIVYSVDDAS